MDTNITWHTASVSKDERRVKNGHHSFVIGLLVYQLRVNLQ